MSVGTLLITAGAAALLLAFGVLVVVLVSRPKPAGMPPVAYLQQQAAPAAPVNHYAAAAADTNTHALILAANTLRDAVAHEKKVVELGHTFTALEKLLGRGPAAPQPIPAPEPPKS